MQKFLCQQWSFLSERVHRHLLWIHRFCRTPGLHFRPCHLPIRCTENPSLDKWMQCHCSTEQFFFQNTFSPLWMSGLSLLNHSTVNRSCFCRFTSWGSEWWNGGYCKKGSGGEKTSVRSESEMKCFSISDIDKKLISDIPNKNVCSCLTLSDLNW